MRESFFYLIDKFIDNCLTMYVLDYKTLMLIFLRIICQHAFPTGLSYMVVLNCSSLRNKVPFDTFFFFLFLNRFSTSFSCISQSLIKFIQLKYPLLSLLQSHKHTKESEVSRKHGRRRRSNNKVTTSQTKAWQ